MLLLGRFLRNGRGNQAVPAILGIALFAAALVAGGDTWFGLAAYAGAYLLIGWDVLKTAFIGLRHGAPWMKTS